jgi:hypothetical protein
VILSWRSVHVSLLSNSLTVLALPHDQAALGLSALVAGGMLVAPVQAAEADANVAFR